MGRGRSETPIEDYQSTLYSGSCSRSGSYVAEGYEQESGKNLNAVVAHLVASVKHLSEANTTLKDELTNVKNENESFASRLTKIEEFVSKLEEKADQKPSKTRSNDHSTLKVCISAPFQRFALVLTLIYRPFCTHSSASCVELSVMVQRQTGSPPSTLSSHLTTSNLSKCQVMVWRFGIQTGWAMSVTM